MVSVSPATFGGDLGRIGPHHACSVNVKASRYVSDEGLSTRPRRCLSNCIALRDFGNGAWLTVKDDATVAEGVKSTRTVNSYHAAGLTNMAALGSTS